MLSSVLHVCEIITGRPQTKAVEEQWAEGNIWKRIFGGDGGKIP
jgi:hypothetical protein